MRATPGRSLARGGRAGRARWFGRAQGTGSGARWLGCLAGFALVATACSGGGDAGSAGSGTGTGTEAGTGNEGVTAGESGTTGTAAPAGATAGQLCSEAAAEAAPPAIAETALTEASGLAASRSRPGVLWAHNDSGGEAEVFAIGPDGAALGRYPLEGAEALDWEDMALGPAGPDGADHLFLGDIGDNRAGRDEVVVYRVPEPTLPSGPSGSGSSGSGSSGSGSSDAGQAGAGPTGGEAQQGRAVGGVEALVLSYPDGPRDAEALLADPLTGDLFVVAKEWGGTPPGVYRLPAAAVTAAAGPGAPETMERVGEAGLPAGEIVTGGDVSADGRLVALRTYGGILLWDRAPGTSVAEALAGTPCRAPAAGERQGEAIAVLPGGRGYVTVGEGEAPPLNRFRLP